MTWETFYTGLGVFLISVIPPIGHAGDVGAERITTEHVRKHPMSSIIRSVRDAHTIADGTAAAIVRVALMATAVGIVLIGLLQLPSIATTHGEMAVGLLLSLLVGVQIFVAALRFPLGSH